MNLEDQTSARARIIHGRTLLKNIENFPLFCKKCLSIIPREGGKLLDFELNIIQMWFFKKYILEPWLRGIPIRVIILKARQFGMTTLIAAFSMWCTLRKRYWGSLLIAKNDDQAELIFEMTHRYLDNLPQGDLVPHFPTTRNRADLINFGKPDEIRYAKRLSEMNFKVFLDSRIRIMSGEKRGALGRAGTFQTVHGSEVAYWVSLKESMSALMSTVIDAPETALFLETTANGFNEFHTLWTYGEVDDEDTPFTFERVFLPWYWNREYEFKSTKIKKRFLDEHEEQLFNKILVDDTIEEVPEHRVWRKLFWRRKEIAKRQGDLDDFCQEYPATPEEAFVHSGRATFPKAVIEFWESKVCEPTFYDVALSKTGAPQIHEHEDGLLKIWEKPQPDEKYIVSADVAEGKAVKGGGRTEKQSKFDFTAAHVLKVTPYPPVEQVGIWHGSIDPDLVADIFVALARYYNNALLGWEVNSIGRGIIYHVCQRLRYTNVYRHDHWDKGGLEIKAAVGWKTTATTKSSMVHITKQFGRERTLILHDGATVMEMKSYTTIGEGKYKALSGHDDRCEGLCIGCAMAEPKVDLFQRQKAHEIRKRENKKRRNDPYGKMRDKNWNPILGNEF